MKKIIIKIITIIIAFLLGIVSMSYLYNKGNLDMTAHMSEATLPVLYFEHEGNLINPTYGYTSDVDATCHLQNLQCQNQIPGKGKAVAYDHRTVRRIRQKKIPGDGFLGGTGVQRIGTGYIGNMDGVTGMEKSTRFGFHRFAGPVSRMLPQAGESVEYGAFANIGIACQGGADDAHVFSPSDRHTVTRAASSRRRAIRAPRIR